VSPGTPSGKKRFFLTLKQKIKMVSRKSKTVKEEFNDAQKHLKEVELRFLEVQELLKLSQEEEIQTLANTETSIKDISASINAFCGVILTHQDVLNIVSIAMETSDNIRIPFKLYYND
jgi:hypothetical protein